MENAGPERLRLYNCQDAIKLMSPTKKFKKNCNFMKRRINLESSFLSLLKKPALLIHLLRTINFKLVVLLWVGAKQTFRVVFDSSFLDLPKNQIKYWFFCKNGSLYKKANSIGPRINLVPSKYQATPLGRLLSLQNDAPDPTTPSEMQHFCEANNTSVECNFIVSEKPLFTICWYKTMTPDPIKIYCFFNEYRKLCFTAITNKEKPPIEIENLHLKLNNRRTSIFLKDSGLNLAKRLGIINKEEFKSLSSVLAAYNGFLTIDMVKNKVKKIYYNDGLAEFTVNGAHWNEVFSAIETRAKVLKHVKEQVLKSVLERLEPFNVVQTSLYKQCYTTIQKHICKMKIYTFGIDDSTLHAIKVPLALYYKAKYPKSKASVFIKLSKKGDFSSITYKQLTIINMYQICGISLEKTIYKVLRSWEPTLSKDMPSIMLFNLFSYINQHCLINFDIDLTTLPFISMAHLSNLIFWSLYIKHAETFLVHPIEKSSTSTQQRLRDYSKGGFSFSAEKAMKAGDPVVGNGEPAQVLANYDIVASYGYAGANIRAPSGFGSIYEDGVRVETSQRYKFFEFRAVFYTIYRWEVIEKRKLIAVYHNYSPLGVFYISKYPMDLVGIFVDGSCEIIQFDSVFCHGCACIELPRYASDQTRQEVVEKTRVRNEATLKWIQDVKLQASYKIETDCCSQLYTKPLLDFYFNTIPELKRLIEGYSSIDGSIENVHPEITFIAIADVTCPTAENLKYKPIFINNSTTCSGKMLLTKDYYTYLKQNFEPINILNIEYVIFHKRDYIFNLVYDHLLKLRTESAGCIKQFYKQAINLSCGFFGSTLKNNFKFVRITDNLPVEGNLQQYSIYPLESNLSLIKTHWSLKQRGSADLSFSLPIFCYIIEYGKMRMNEIYNFYQQNFKPTSFDILYTHIDSTIVALSQDKLEDCVVNLQEFKKDLLNYFGDAPGNLKLVWRQFPNDEWTFVTPGLLSWAMISKTKSIAKMNNVSNISPSQIYNTQCQILSKTPSSIIQKRRRNKIQNTKTISKTFIYNP